MNFNCDKIVCINLKKRKDKKAHVINEIKKINLKIDFFEGIENNTEPTNGCFSSHVKVIKDAYDEGVNRLMVLEDDIYIPDNLSKKSVSDVNKFLDNDDDWQIFLLGGAPWIFTENVQSNERYDGVYKGSFFLTHAYILNRKGMKKYKNCKWSLNRKSWDLDIIKNSKHNYTIYPPLIVQIPLKNDIGKDSILFLKIRNFTMYLIGLYGFNINIRLRNIGIVLIIIFYFIVVLKPNNPFF